MRGLKAVGKQVFIWIGFAIVVAIGWWFRDYLNISPGTLLLFAVLAIYMQFAMDGLGERLGFSEFPTKKWLEDLVDGKPIVPVHENQEPLPAEGWAIDEHVHLFFEHFSQFGLHLNESLSDSPWRLQLQRDTDVSTLGDDGPVYGFNFKVFYNTWWAGEIRLRSRYKYSLEKSNIFATIEIRNARLFSYSSIRELLGAMAVLLVSDTNEDERAAMASATAAMIAIMWEIGPNCIHNPDLEWSVSGTADFYLRRAGYKHLDESESLGSFFSGLAQTKQPGNP